jgi:hypothetical protein
MSANIDELLGIGWHQQIVILDRDNLWQQLDDPSTAYENQYDLHIITDEMELRYRYEKDYRDHRDKKCILLIHGLSIFIPYDIEQAFHVVLLGYETLYPHLDAETLRSIRLLDLRLLQYAVEHSYIPQLSASQTRELCLYGMYERSNAVPYANALLQRCAESAPIANSYLDWSKIAADYGKASMLYHTYSIEMASSEYSQNIQQAFRIWMATQYKMLSGSVDRNQPVILSSVADFMRKQRGKVAVLVMDGMSFENLFTIMRALADATFSFDVRGIYSFLPSTTAVARQTIFSGKLPVQNAQPFTLALEEKQWYSYWQQNGLQNHEIFFGKSDKIDLQPQWKAIGIIVNTVDELMHTQRLGMQGFQQDILTWVRSGKLQKMIEQLNRAGFSIFMTADHGNTAAIGQGRFTSPGILAEPASRRAVIYQDYANPLELAKFSVSLYSGTYLPREYHAYLFEPGACYGDQGKEYITHGGMTLEEVIVPFVRVGA